MLSKFVYLFLKMFYRHLYGANPYYVLVSTFFPQKILRINGRVQWPVSFRSKVIHHKNIKVGRRSFPGWSDNCYIQGRNGIIIGNNLRMGPGVGLISANHSVNDYDKWSDAKPMVIGNNVWLGMNTVVLPGVTIGDNVIIGANSTVASDIPANSIAVGSPCRVIKPKPPYEGKDYSKP